MASKTLVVAFIAVAALGGYYYKTSRDHPGKNGPSFTVVDHMASHHFTPLDDVHAIQFALFGGNKADGSLMGEFFVAGLPLGIARALAAQYPDFYRCDSPASSAVQARMLDFGVFPRNHQLYVALRDMLRENDKRIWNGGKRMCFSLSGKSLTRSSGSLVPGVGFSVEGINPRYLWLDDLKVFDCDTVI